MKAAYTSFSEGLGFTAYGIVELLQKDLKVIQEESPEYETKLKEAQQYLEELRNIEILRLHYLGLSNERIAQHLQCTESSLERFLAKAKKGVGITVTQTSLSDTKGTTE